MLLHADVKQVPDCALISYFDLITHKTRVDLIDRSEVEKDLFLVTDF